MRSGKMRHRVAIKSVSYSEADDGEVIPSWSSTLATVWAEVMDKSGKEFFEAQRVNAKVTTIVKIRYRSDITPDMRLTEGSRTLRILTILDHDGRERETVIWCEEVVD